MKHVAKAIEIRITMQWKTGISIEFTLLMRYFLYAGTNLQQILNQKAYNEPRLIIFKNEERPSQGYVAEKLSSLKYRNLPYLWE